MSEPKLEVYRKYYEMIVAKPGLTLAEYAKPLPNIGYTNLKNAFANMEYYGFLLYEGNSGDLHPYKIIRRLPGDLKEINPIGRNGRWKRTRTTTIPEPMQIKQSGIHLKYFNWWSL